MTMDCSVEANIMMAYLRHQEPASCGPQNLGLGTNPTTSQKIKKITMAIMYPGHQLIPGHHLLEHIFLVDGQIGGGIQNSNM